MVSTGTARTVLVEGDGQTFPSPGDTLTMHYTGFLKTGQRFDSSYDRNKTFTFVIGRGDVIKGWEEAVPQMSLGEKARLEVPSELAYGSEGADKLVPPHADLVFEMELLRINSITAPSLQQGHEEASAMLLEIYEHFRGPQRTCWGFDEAKAFWALANANRGTTPLTEAFWNGNLPKLLGFDTSVGMALEHLVKLYARPQVGPLALYSDYNSLFPHKPRPLPPALQVQKLSEEKISSLSAEERKQMAAALGHVAAGVSAMPIMNKSGVTGTIGEADGLAPNSTLLLKSCVDCQFTIVSYCTKVLIQGCKGCTFKFESKVITGVAEVWGCSDLVIELRDKLGTLQVDGCTNVAFSISQKANYCQMIWADSHKLAVNFGDVDDAILTGLDSLDQVAKEQQFIVRFVHNAVKGKDEIKCEKLIRLENGFPTTLREKTEFERRQKDNIQKLAKEAGIGIGRSAASDAEKVGRNEPCKCGSGKKSKKCCGL